ncbi:MAG: LURP-one-related family protein [Ruminococcus sp.]|uniref:LURP-one-related/scramblase family protein n=1 Tax=Ruminococcus sp. TaxID=41978 RepID=UPI0025F26069|nr:LURP-one-related family protein [Ruminococcus sp.]MBR5683393.1 LURP-one-related family protein [Ruminococcus sp.]
MKLYFKQRLFSFRQCTDIFDEHGNVMFTAEGEIFSLGRKMHIYDMDRCEVGFVQQKLLHFMPRFSVFINGQYMADVVKEFTLFSQNYCVEGLGWHIDGNVFAHDYRITCGGSYIASIHKHWMSWGDSYEIDIAYEQDIVMALAVIIAIDCVIDQAQVS